MYINVPLLYLGYNLLSRNIIFTIKNCWNHASLVLGCSLLGHQDDKKIPSYVGTGTSERAVWLLLNETLNWCPATEVRQIDGLTLWSISKHSSLAGKCSVYKNNCSLSRYIAESCQHSVSHGSSFLNVIFPTECPSWSLPQKNVGESSLSHLTL